MKVQISRRNTAAMMMSRNRLALVLALAAATAYTATGEFLKGASADRVKGDRRLPYYPPPPPVEPPGKSKKSKSKKGGSKGYDPCYGKGKGKGKGSGTFTIIAIWGRMRQAQRLLSVARSSLCSFVS